MKTIQTILLLLASILSGWAQQTVSPKDMIPITPMVSDELPVADGVKKNTGIESQTNVDNEWTSLLFGTVCTNPQHHHSGERRYSNSPSDVFDHNGNIFLCSGCFSTRQSSVKLYFQVKESTDKNTKL